MVLNIRNFAQKELIILDKIFNEVFAFTSSEITFQGMIATLITSLLFGFVLGITYLITQKKEGYQRSFVITLIMLPVILSMIIIFVGSNLARAFSLAGTIAVIRYRSVPGDPKDIGYVFFAVGAGLACGVGLFGYGAIFVLALSVVLIIIEKTNFAKPSNKRKILKITVTEDMNYQNAFDEILSESTLDYNLVKIKTTELGSLFELVYYITMDDKTSEREFINKLRCVNGNLSIILTVSATVGVN